MMSHPLVDLYQVRINYTFSGLNHTFQTWLKPDGFTTVPTGLFSDYDLSTPSGVIDANAWRLAFITPFAGLFANTTTFNTAELWAYPADSADGLFLAAQTITAVGTNVGANLIAGQVIFTGRTLGGRIKKFYSEEGAGVPGVPVSWDTGAGAFNTWGTFVLNPANGAAMVDRAGNRVIALSQVFQGQNEATFKRRYRPSN